MGTYWQNYMLHSKRLKFTLPEECLAPVNQIVTFTESEINHIVMPIITQVQVEINNFGMQSQATYKGSC